MAQDTELSLIHICCFEKSNVDANKEITSLMETQRLFEASSAVLKCMDTINGRAASEIIKL